MSALIWNSVNQKLAAGLDDDDVDIVSYDEKNLWLFFLWAFAYRTSTKHSLVIIVQEALSMGAAPNPDLLLLSYRFVKCVQFIVRRPRLKDHPQRIGQRTDCVCRLDDAIYILLMYNLCPDNPEGCLHVCNFA